MRYRIVCPVCDEQYYVDVCFEPQMCFKCGHKEVFVSNHKTQPRVNAEIVMAELDELAPKIDAAYEEYLHLTTMWYPWKKSYDQPRQDIKKHGHMKKNLADKGLSSQSFGFSNSHVWM